MIRVLQRALKVLECFDLDRPRLSLHDISQMIALPKSTTFRILSTLVAEGYLVQLEKQEYALSHKFMRLASVAQQSVGLHDFVHPVLERLAAATGETVEVSRLDGDSRICIDVVESSSSLKSIVFVGIRLPLPFGATGKVFLAHLDPEDTERIVASHPESSALDRAVLAGQLTAIREQGFSLTRDERVVGATAIAVPLYDHHNKVSYCLTVTGPGGRFVGREAMIQEIMLAAGAELSSLLGGVAKPTAPDKGKATRGAAKLALSRVAEAGRISGPVIDPTPVDLGPDNASSAGSDRALTHLRVLDLTQDLGYASKLFADLGATVVLVEPPEGISARGRGPFVKGSAGPDHSLHFQYLSAGKHSVVIDFDRPEGRASFEHLLEGTDLVIDDQLQSVWAERGLDYATLSARHPNLIWTAITWFGQQGPRANEQADDFTIMAAGGMAWLTGYQDSGPLVPEGQIALYSAAQYAAVMSQIAVFGRARSGGQFVDISVQEVVALGTETAPQFYELQGKTRRRLGEDERQAGIGLYPCRDGHVLLYAADSGLGTGWRDLVDWMTTDVPEAALLGDPIWKDNAYKASSEAKAAFRALFTRFAAGHGKQELFEEGQRRHIAIAPINESDATFADPHFADCAFFTTVAEIDGQAVIGPGAPYRLSATPWSAGKRAPHLGEHTEELLRDLVAAS